MSEQRMTTPQQYHFYKDIANSGKAPQRILKDGTVIPAKTHLTTVERVRAANKAEKALTSLNQYFAKKKKEQEKKPTPPPKPKPQIQQQVEMQLSKTPKVSKGHKGIYGISSSGNAVLIAETRTVDINSKPQTKTKTTKGKKNNK